MKKVLVVMLASILLLTAISCNNPNKSPTDKVGGYHTSSIQVEKDARA